MANNVRNIRELRARKKELKRKMEAGFDNPFSEVKGVLQNFTNGNQNPMALFDKSDESSNQLMDEGVKAVLTLAASTAVTRFKLGPVPKMLLTAGVALATPYVVGKIQKAIQKKFS